MTTPDVELPSPQQMLKELGCGVLGILTRALVFGLIIGNLFMFCKAMVLHAYTPDLPWLLHAGEWIVAHGKLPATDLFSWTYPDKPWVLYQWLFEVALAKLSQILSLDALVRGFTLLAIGLYVFLPFIRLRPLKPLWLPTLFIGSVCLYGAGVNLSIRPMVITSLALAVQFLLLHFYRQKKLSWRWLYPSLAMVYLLWANMHTGVVLGFFSLWVMALGDTLEQGKIYSFEPSEPALEGQPLPLSTYVKVFAVTLLASLLNPYGFEIYTYLATLSNQHFLNEIIMELQSPNFRMLNFVYFAGLLVSLIVMSTRANKHFSLQEWLHLVIFSILTLYVSRFVVWACLFYALILPKALIHGLTTSPQQTSSKIRDWFSQLERYRPMVLTVLVLGGLLFAFFPQLAKGHLYPINRGGCDAFDSGIRAYHRLQRPSDKTFTEPEIGSCSLALFPQDKVFIDTRFDFYQDRFTRLNHQTLTMNTDWQKAFSQWDINTVLISNRWSLVMALLAHPDYTIIYKDKAITIFRRRARASF